MTEQEIKKAFNGRWRFKVESFLSKHNEQEPISYDMLKGFCFDFFEIGYILGSGDTIRSIISDKEFEKWWDMYDKKRGRDKCLAKWKKLTSTERLSCMEATPAYVASTPDKQYRKDPLTYLNQKAWKDEIIIRNNPEQQRNSRYRAAAELIQEYGKQNSGDQK